MAASWETRFAEAVRRLAALRESTALELLPDLMPVLPVIPPEDPWYRLLRRERLVQAWGSCTAAAGQTAGVSFFNPAASGKLMQILGVRVWLSGGADHVTCGVGAWTTGTGTNIPNQACYQDSRGGVFLPVLRNESLVNPSYLSSNLTRCQTAWVPGALDAGQVLHPGYGLIIGTTTAGVNTLYASILAVERTVDSAELNTTGA